MSQKIEESLSQRCNCFCATAENSNCLDQFTHQEVYQIRLEIINQGPQGSIDARRRDARAGILLNRHIGIRKCTPTILGRTVCMKAYSLLTGHSYTSMATDNTRIYADCAFERIGRPRKTISKSIRDCTLSSQKSQLLLAWLCEWLKYNADSHPTGHEHSWSMNFIRRKTVYAEYCHSMDSSGTPEAVPSLRTMYRVWKYFTESERIYVRMKCKTSTKCRG